jgi:hypothetical protein
MHAVLRIDVYPIGIVFIFDKLIHPGWAIPTFGPCILRQIHFHWHHGGNFGGGNFRCQFILGRTRPRFLKLQRHLRDKQ